MTAEVVVGVLDWPARRASPGAAGGA